MLKMYLGRDITRVLNKDFSKIIKQYECLLFDFDGTLVDTDRLNFSVYKKIFNIFKLKLTFKDWNFFFNGSSAQISLKKYLEYIDKTDLFDDIFSYFKLKADAIKEGVFNESKIKVIKNGSDLLLISVRLKKEIFLCSSSRKETIVNVLDKLGWEKFFEDIVCLDDVKRAKPYPDIFEKAMSKSKAKTFLAIEDSNNGFDAAVAAGCDCLLIKNNSVYFYRNYAKSFENIL